MEKQVENTKKAEKMQQKRSQMSEMEKQVENTKIAEKMQQKHSRMSEVEKQAEKTKTAKKMKQKRGRMSEEVKGAEKFEDFESKKQKRQTVSDKRNDYLKIVDLHIDECIDSVIDDVSSNKTVPMFTCASCKKVLFCDQIHWLKELNDKCGELSMNLNCELCWSCCDALKKGNMPAKCYLNNLDTDTVPNVLSELSFLERRFVCPVQSYMTLVKLTPGDQYAQKGLAIHFPSEPKEVLYTLP